jgi:hypothetical protein
MLRERGCQDNERHDPQTGRKYLQKKILIKLSKMCIELFCWWYWVSNSGPPVRSPEALSLELHPNSTVKEGGLKNVHTYCLIPKYYGKGKIMDCKFEDRFNISECHD